MFQTADNKTDIVKMYYSKKNCRERRKGLCVEITRANNCFNKINKDFDWIINTKSRDKQ